MKPKNYKDSKLLTLKQVEVFFKDANYDKFKEQIDSIKKKKMFTNNTQIMFVNSLLNEDIRVMNYVIDELKYVPSVMEILLVPNYVRQLYLLERFHIKKS